MTGGGDPQAAQGQPGPTQEEPRRDVTVTAGAATASGFATPDDED